VPFMVVLLVLVIAVTTYIVKMPRQSEWVARSRMIIEPARNESTTEGAYALDVLSRKGVMATYAALVDSSRVRDEAMDDVVIPAAKRDGLRTSASASSATQVVTTEVRGKSRNDVARLAFSLRNRGIDLINELGGPYKARAVDAPEQIFFDNGIKLIPFFALVAVWSVGVTLIVFLLRRNREPALD